MLAKKSDFACVAASAATLARSSSASAHLRSMNCPTCPPIPSNRASTAAFGSRMSVLKNSITPQKPAGTDDRKAKRAVQAVLRRRRRPWEVRVVDNVSNTRGSPGAPNPARKPNAVPECDATIDLNHFVQEPRRGHVHLRATEHMRLKHDARRR